MRYPLPPRGLYYREKIFYRSSLQREDLEVFFIKRRPKGLLFREYTYRFFFTKDRPIVGFYTESSYYQREDLVAFFTERRPRALLHEKKA